MIADKEAVASYLNDNLHAAKSDGATWRRDRDDAWETQIKFMGEQKELKGREPES